MATRRTLAVVLGLLAGVQTAPAQQTYPLAEEVKPGDCFRIQLTMELTGEMRVGRGGKTVPLKLSAAAAHDFAERILNVGATGLAEKSARAYETAKADITVEGGRSQRALRAERRLIVAQRHKDQPLVYCPAGALTREEVELTGDHFDPLALTGLLPGKPVAVGATWKVPNAVAQALCHFEGLTEHDLTGKLEKVEGKVAIVSVTGSATGIDQGALAKLKVQAVCKFDLEARRLAALEWKQQDEREQGPASPAASVQVGIILMRSAIPQPQTLSDVALVSVPDGFAPPASMTQLEYRESKNRFELVYGREWHLTGQTEDHVVMRLLQRGDFVAQLTVTPWTPAAKGRHLSAEEFRQAMAQTPGWQPKQELQAGEVLAEGGRWVYRLSALGRMDGQDVLQNFYLVAAPTGEQVVLAFTMPPKQAEHLGTRDLAIAGSLEFPSCRKEKLNQP